MSDPATVMCKGMVNINGTDKYCEVYYLAPVRGPFGTYDFSYGTCSSFNRNLPCPVEGCDQYIQYIQDNDNVYNGYYRDRVCRHINDYVWHENRVWQSERHEFIAMGDDENPQLVRVIG